MEDTTFYDEFKNRFYNPTENDQKPGENENWRNIQKGFLRVWHNIEPNLIYTAIGATDFEVSVIASGSTVAITSTMHISNFTNALGESVNAGDDMVLICFTPIQDHDSSVVPVSIVPGSINEEVGEDGTIDVVTTTTFFNMSESDDYIYNPNCFVIAAKVPG